MQVQIYFLSGIMLTSLGISRHSVQAVAMYDDGVDGSCDQVSSQLDMLRSGNENLKLRLEMMEHHFDKQRQSHNDLERKLDQQNQKLDRLLDRLLEQQERQHNELRNMIRDKECFQQSDHSEFLVLDEKTEFLKEFQKVTKLQTDILQKLDSKRLTASTASLPITVDEEGADEKTVHVPGINVCWGIYTKILGELSSNLTILQNIENKLTKIEDQYSQESDKHKKTLEISHGLLKFLNKKEESKICVQSNDQTLMCTEEPHPSSCANYDKTHCSENKCRIRNILYGPESFLVACDDQTEGGGWTVIQRRLNGSVDFYRGWSEYKTGFGDLDGEFWIGLDKLHALTTTLAPVELLIQLKDHNDTMKYAKYGKFAIGNEEELYVLREASGYEGNAGDSFSYHQGSKFSTKDKDNDADARYNCATDKRGAWWYESCQWSNLNGFYYKTGVVPRNETGRGVNWGVLHGYNYSMKFVQMMIRTKRS